MSVLSHWISSFYRTVTYYLSTVDVFRFPRFSLELLTNTKSVEGLLAFTVEGRVHAWWDTAVRRGVLHLGTHPHGLMSCAIRQTHNMSSVPIGNGPMVR